MDSLLNQAIAAHKAGSIEEAERLYRAIPDGPDRGQGLALLGVLLGGRGAHQEGRGSLEQAVALEPSSPLLHFYLGNILCDMGDWQAAIQSFDRALTLEPHFAEAHYRLALALEKRGRRTEALTHLGEATRLKPEIAELWVALSDVARQEKDYIRALQAADEAVRLMPENVAASIAQGLALDWLDREDEALLSFKHAISLRPNFIEAWDMLGTTYQNLNRLDEAQATMIKAIEMAGGAPIDENEGEVAESDYTTQHWNLALLELLRGDFRHGFAHYRARFKKPGRSPRLPVPRPLWGGEDLRGKKILVVGEQGFGDVFMLCRYGALLKERGARVVMLVHEALGALLRLSNVADEIICEAPAQQGDFDYQASLFDLPYRLGTEIATIPKTIPYLARPQVPSAMTLPADGRLRVGIVWSGRSDFGNDRRRSLTPQLFAPLFDKTNIHYFSLNRDLKTDEAAFLARHHVTDLSAKLSDFLATAQLLNQLDLVISCDTGVAHLAGAMGKKTWILLPFSADWRWLTERDDSPWYPTVRLFRQTQRADWKGVIARVKAALDTGI